MAAACLRVSRHRARSQDGGRRYGPDATGRGHRLPPPRFATSDLACPSPALQHLDLRLGAFVKMAGARLTRPLRPA
eukprot:5230279-Prymnesium_polylepis.1